MMNSTPSWPGEYTLVPDTMWDKLVTRLQGTVKSRCRSHRAYEMHVTLRFVGGDLKGWTKPEITDWEPASQAEELAL